MTATIEHGPQLDIPSVWVPIKLGNEAVLHRVVPKHLVELGQRLVAQQVFWEYEAGDSPTKGDDSLVIARETPFYASVTDTPGMHEREIRRSDGIKQLRKEMRTTFTVADCRRYKVSQLGHGSRIGEINEAIIPAGRFSYNYKIPGELATKLTMSEFIFLEPVIPEQR